MHIDELKIGESATILKVDDNRLTEMGFRPGVKVTRLSSGIYRVGAFKVILRNLQVTVEPRNKVDE